MPLPMVHLAVAHAVADAIRVDSPQQFYLGCNSPDAVHMLDGYEYAHKQRSHLDMHGGWRFYDNRDETLARLASLMAVAPTEHRDFFTGYAVHLLTDTCWNSIIMPMFKERFVAAGGNEQDRSKAYYNDTDLLDIDIFNAASWRDEVWALLESAQPIDFGDLLTADAIDRWNTRTLHWFEQSFEQLTERKYLDMTDVDAFVATAAAECVGMLKGQE